MLGGCSLRGGEGSIIGIVLGTVLLQVLQNLVNLLGIPSSLNFAVMGDGDPDRRARRPVPRAAQSPRDDGQGTAAGKCRYSAARAGECGSDDWCRR